LFTNSCNGEMLNMSNVETESIDREKELVSEYANRLFEPSVFYGIPYPVTIKCPICGCIEVRISALTHKAEKDGDGDETTSDILEFEGECAHCWHIEFASIGGLIYVGDSHCGDDVMISLNEAKDAPEELGALFG